jgi:HPt (histidine-containing phosphotransfer) domain-containing protein
VWSRSRPTVERRLGNLERAAEAAATGSLEGETLSAAETDAHKLAGALGTFGFPQASDLAREAELELARGPGPGTAPKLSGLVAAIRSELDPDAGR